MQSAILLWQIRLSVQCPMDISLHFPGNLVGTLLLFLSPSTITKFQGEALSGSVKYMGCENFVNITSVAETVRDRPMITMDHQ